MKRLLVSILLTMAVFHSGCSDNPVSESGIITPKSWSTPKLINTLTGDDRNALVTRCINTNRESGVDVLVTVPEDTLYKHRDFSAHLLRFEHGTWNETTSFRGLGVFSPCTIRRDNEDLNVLWQGVSEDRAADWQAGLTRATDMFHLRCSNGSCGEGSSIFKSIGTFIPELQRNTRGELSSVVDLRDYAQNLILHGDVWSKELVGVIGSPRKYTVGDAEYMVYVDASSENTGVANVIFFIERSSPENEWSNPKVLFEAPDRQGHFPTILVDDSGILHVIFFTLDAVGSWTLVYTNRGVNSIWSPLVALGTRKSLPGSIPTLMIESDRTIHAFWSFIYSEGNSLFENWHNALDQDRIWSRAEVLFGNVDHLSPVLTSIDSNDRIHAVITSRDGRIYHSIFE